MVRGHRYRCDRLACTGKHGHDVTGSELCPTARPPKPRPSCRRCGKPRERVNAKLCDLCSVRSKISAKLKYAHGITLEQYEELLARQGGVCAICRRRPTKNRLSVDHDHRCCPGRRSCGKCIRGLLCKECNYHLLGAICHETQLGVAYAHEVLDRVKAYLAGCLEFDS